MEKGKEGGVVSPSSRDVCLSVFICIYTHMCVFAPLDICLGPRSNAWACGNLIRIGFLCFSCLYGICATYKCVCVECMCVMGRS